MTQAVTLANAGVQGSAKAWVNFNGTNGAIRSSYNVSSVVRNSTGSYTVNFSTPFADTNYSVAGMLSDRPGTDYGGQIAVAGAAIFTGSATLYTSTPYSLGQYDSAVVCIQIFR